MSGENANASADRNTESAPAEQQTADLFYGNEGAPKAETDKSLADGNPNAPIKEEASKTEAKSEESKPAEEKQEEKHEGEKKPEEKTDAKAEVKFELKLPKDSLLSPERVKEIEAFAKAEGLTQAQAQKIVERDNNELISFQQSQQEQIETNRTKWFEECQGDKEIGGVDFGKNVEHAARALKHFGSETLRKELNESGLGNHPELVRMMVRIGKSMSNDKFIRAGAASPSEKSIEDMFYGETKL